MEDRTGTVRKTASGAGRGVLWTGLGKLYFVLVGMVITFVLPRLLDPSTFGAFTLVNNITSLVNGVLITGTIQTVSRDIAHHRDDYRSVQAAGLRMHLVLGLPIAIAFVALAPGVSWFLEDSDKTAPLMLSGMIIGGYAFYAVFVGTANGTHQFHKQGGFDIMFATLRATGLLGTAYLGFKVIGVIGGWVGAVVAILAIAVAWVGLPGKTSRHPVRPMLKYFGGVGVYLALNNALLFVDTILLKRLITDFFAGQPDPAELADRQVAFYAAVQNLGRVPYQLILAAAFVVFPLVSKSTMEGDKEATRRYVGVTTRYSLMFAMLIAVVLAALPDGVLGLIYSPEYVAHGGPEMLPIAFGNVAFALIAIACTILNGADKTRAAIGVAATTLVVAAAGNSIAIPLASTTDDALQIAAYTTAGSMVLGACIAAFVMIRSFGAFLPPLSLVRVAAAVAVGITVGRYLPLHGKLLALVAAVIVAGVYLVVLVATRELDKRDLAAIKALRRAPRGDAQ